MSVITLEGVVEQGRIRLPADVRLPEKMRVYVIVPDVQSEPVRNIVSPRLVHPEQIGEFKMQVTEETTLNWVEQQTQ
jgi:hypothetical protein